MARPCLGEKRNPKLAVVQLKQNDTGHKIIYYNVQSPNLEIQNWNLSDLTYKKKNNGEFISS